MRRGGFTLIEFVGVLALMALLTGVAAVSLSAFARGHAAEDAFERISFADALVRDRASMTGRSMVLRLDLAANTLAVVNGRDVTVIGQLPGSARLAEVMTGSGRVGYGRVDVPFSAAGFAPTFAVRLEQPPGVPRRWLVSSGLTGEFNEVADADIASMFQPTP